MTKSGCLALFAGSGLLLPGSLPPTSKLSLNPPELNQPLTVLPGVGGATAKEAGKLGIATLGDLICHFPYRHEDFTSSRKIGELKWGEEATVSCRVERVALKRTRRRNLRLVTAVVGDETGPMNAVWFNQDYLAGRLKPGDNLLVRGIYDGPGNSFRVKSHEILGGGEAGLHTSGFVPVYSTTEKISVKRLRGWLGRIRPLGGRIADPLPPAMLARLSMPLKADSVLSMHFPRRPADYHLARRRLVFEELLLLQAGLLLRRRILDGSRTGVRLEAEGDLTRRFLSALPFELTPDQKRVCAEISGDLMKARPMQRLLQGDVGAGKTVVAVYTILRAVESGRQAAMMAPTEVLAEQHFFSLQRLLSALPLRLAFFSSRLTPAERRPLLKRLADGDIDIAVGTHALIQPDIAFARLAAVVVDEQHRFGVRQREELAAKAARGGPTPHMLHMTATPIPRTLALTLYGDLDVSTIVKMPAGRRKVSTWLVPEAKRPGAYRFIREQLDAGRQCFVVCPLIEEPDDAGLRAVETEADRLGEGEFSGYRLGVLHGQMPAAEKKEMMGRFAAGEIQVLVTTTVIEVGVDVANATVMMIEEADRFGLAQLHQLRGRVGRGKHRSYCLLFGDPKTGPAEKRLAAMRSTNDGFALADLDLKIRGEGQLLGERQSGLPDLKLARLARDREILMQARREARALLEDDPALARPENALFKDEISRAFSDSLDWLERV